MTPVDTPRRGRPADDGVSFGAAVGAVCVGLVLGLLVLSYVHSTRQEKSLALRAKLGPAKSALVPALSASNRSPAIASAAPSSSVTLAIPEGPRPAKHKVKPQPVRAVPAGTTVVPPNPYE